MEKNSGIIKRMTAHCSLGLGIFLLVIGCCFLAIGYLFTPIEKEDTQIVVGKFQRIEDRQLYLFSNPNYYTLDAKAYEYLVNNEAIRYMESALFITLHVGTTGFSDRTIYEITCGEVELLPWGMVRGKDVAFDIFCWVFGGVLVLIGFLVIEGANYARRKSLCP